MYQKIIAVIFLLINVAFSQISISEIEKYSNDQLDLIKSELKNQNLNVPDEASGIIDVNTSEVSIEVPEESIKNEFFGYDYFNRSINFFDNIPTPSDFKLGPGDEIIISLWGENNSRENFVINKDGLIYYENIGFINLSNKTIPQAETILVNELSRIYSTLKDENNQTQLMLELGKLKSVNVYFSGNVQNPGIHLIHPFSDVFSAIVQSGGIQTNGSLRKVEIIRSNETISTIDFYSFFMTGKNIFSNIRIMDGDIIHVPDISIRASIEGDITNEGSFELIENESIAQLIDYAGGLKATASSRAIIDRITPLAKRSSDDNARSSQNINFNEFSVININDGDNIKILSIGDVSSKVELFGRVKFPGEYAASSSLKDVLDIAGGFDDPTYRKTIRDDEIVILRKDENQFYGVEYKVSYQDSPDFSLLPDDKIFVYENVNYRNSFTYRVEGEVNKPGTFSLREKITVGEAIDLAEGITELSSVDHIIVLQEVSEISADGEEIITVSDVANADFNFILGNNSIIKAFPKENVVRVEGNVYNPGLVSYNRGLTMYQAIEQAGGFKPNSMKKNAYVKKANGEVNKANIFRGRAMRLSPGDTIIIPVDPEPSNFDITTFLADLSSTLANIAAILLVVERAND